jgi:hypothetical protein
MVVGYQQLANTPNGCTLFPPPGKTGLASFPKVSVVVE